MTTPEPRSDATLTRQRSKMSDADANDGDDGPTKGGHSLRRRARVNYTTEQIEDEVVVPSSSSAARQKRRSKEEAAHIQDSPEAHHPKRQNSSLGADTPTGRRRNPSRRLTENSKPDYFVEEDSDEEVYDTIKVGSWLSGSPTSSSKSGSRNGSISHPPSSSPRQKQNASNLHISDAANSDNGPEAASTAAAAKTNGASTTTSAPPDNGPDDDDQAADQAEDASRQLQDESISSQQADNAAAAAAATADAPTESSMTRRSPDGGSHAPPSPSANHSPQPTARTHSPEANHNLSNAFTVAASTTSAHKHERPDVDAAGNQKSPMPSAVDAEPEAADHGHPSKAQSAQLAAQPENSVDPEQDAPAAKALTDETHTHESEDTKRDERDDHKPSSSPRDTPMIDTPASSPPKADQGSPVASPPHATDASDEAETATATAIAAPKAANEPVVSTPLKEEVNSSSSTKPSSETSRWSRPQPVPQGRWAHLTPYVDGEYTVYPERKNDEDDASEDQSPEEKESSKESNEPDAAAEDNDDTADAAATEAPTPALNTPTRGSPVPDALDTAVNSPAPAADEPDEADESDSTDDLDRKKYYRYRKLRDADEFVTAIENYEDMSTADLYDALQAINLSLVGWQEEWTELGKMVDDYENATRRRIADAKYETRTRNLHQHGVNYEEPDFAVRGYKTKEREPMSETRYLQRQDRIMAAAYGFEYDPHPSKIGRQNPETQQAGVTTRGRALRNQPRQTVKASEADTSVMGKRQRKPVQLYDPATHDNSRASSPVGRGARRHKTANQDNGNDDVQASFASSFGNDNSDGEATGPGRRRRTGRPRASRGAGDDYVPSGSQVSAQDETPRTSGRRGRPKAAKSEDQWTGNGEAEPKQQQGRHMLTLKIPKGQKFSQPSSIADNGDSRPSTASSDSTTETVESSYSFRPKRQKRFRDEPEESPGPAAVQAPPRKRNRRSGPAPAADGDEVMKTGGASAATPKNTGAAASTTSASTGRKGPKIKIMRASGGAAAATPAATAVAPDSRNGTPSSQPTTDGGDEPAKDYRAMTKSEKMSASMKNRWANGNMAGAVEKRKATLAAKKAAQAAADQRVGPIAPKPNGAGAGKPKPVKKEAAPLPGENPAFIHSNAGHRQPQQAPHAPLHQAPMHHPQQHQPMHHQPGPPPPPPPPHHMAGPPHHQMHPMHQHQHQHQMHAAHYGAPPPPHQMHGHPHAHGHPHPHAHHLAHQHPHAPHHPHHDYPGMGAYPS